MKIRRTDSKRLALCLAALTLAACGDSTGVPAPQNVSVNFRAGSGAALLAPVATTDGLGRVAGPPLVVSGSNGSLTLEEVLLIINEVELDPADGSCDVVESSGEDCPEFEAPPRFLDLPLDGEPITAVTALIPAGTYKALDFEVEDLEDDEDDPEVAAAITVVRAQIRSIVPDWPEEASVQVRGTFTPTGGAAVAFRVFLKAEIEIEMPLVPNLVVGEDGSANRSLTVDIRPDIWFTKGDGTVRVLPDWDYDQTNQLLEFDVEMEDGFTKIEIDD